MNDAITKDRSPRSPSITLEEAISMTRKLYDQIRTAAVVPEIAVKPLGYSGTNGTAMSTIATLGQYGLLSRSGKTVSITALAVKILHPKSPEQLVEAIREAALAPKVMSELAEGYLECGQSVIEGHLIQTGFNPDRARRVAAIHLANKAFAKLSESNIVEVPQTPSLFEAETVEPLQQSEQRPTPRLQQPQKDSVTIPENHKMLAQYSIPLGENQATLVFTGTELTPEDFEALGDFVAFAKRQFERTLKKQAQVAQVFRPPTVDFGDDNQNS